MLAGELRLQREAILAGRGAMTATSWSSPGVLDCPCCCLKEPGLQRRRLVLCATMARENVQFIYFCPTLQLTFLPPAGTAERVVSVRTHGSTWHVYVHKVAQSDGHL